MSKDVIRSRILAKHYSRKQARDYLESLPYLLTKVSEDPERYGQQLREYWKRQHKTLEAQNEAEWRTAVWFAYTHLYTEEQLSRMNFNSDVNEIPEQVRLEAERVMVEDLRCPPHWNTTHECLSCGIVPVSREFQPKTLKECPWCKEHGASHFRDLTTPIQ